MLKPLTTGQKIFAYSSLVMIILCTLFGMFIIWLYVNEIILE